MRKIYAILLVFSFVFSKTDKVDLQLNKPTISQKAIHCSRGGVIKTDEITIYAKNFDYIHDKKGDHKVTASGNLLIKFNRYFFIGDSITYDYNTKTGVILNGTGTVNNIISGGKEIYLYEDKSLEIKDAFITPSSTIPPVFEVTSPQVNVTGTTRATAKTMVGKLNGVPFMWLPSWGMLLDAKYKRARTLAYNMTVERGQVPMFWVRYKLYDNDLLQAYTRLEYRVLPLDAVVQKNEKSVEWYEGLGGAIDLDYKTKNKKITFQTRNFASYNIWYLDINANKPRLRYRVQGKYKGLTNNDQVESFVQWDKLSDRFMRTDFPTQQFDIGTLERNEAFVHYRTDPAYFLIAAKPRLNEYRGFNQDLPVAQIAMRPIEVARKSKIYIEQRYTVGYHNYLYAHQLRDTIPNFNSGKFAAIVNMYRPFGYGPLNFTPRVGFDGIVYTNNQTAVSSTQAVCNYGGDASLDFEGDFHYFSHYIKPYAKYNGLTNPTSNNNQHFNFGIKDGYARLNQFIYGISNDFYFRRFPVDVPTFNVNVYGMTFFDTPSLIEPISKAMLDIAWHYPRLERGMNFGWNFEKDTYDFLEANFGWTVNDYIALSSAYRDRGKFWWRKDNHLSFVLDSYHTIDALDQTPLSDARYCVVNKLQLQLAPLWTFQVENNVGRRPSVKNDLGQVIRAQTPYYVQTKMKISMVLSNSYRLGLTYLVSNSKKDNYFTFNFDLM